ncbi:MAG TPA: carboxypeptidase regulatory-like domain-containing protein [Candidatus Polarisedimenticolia bacterium]|nr:carboxypeptidase regulatory-like domain-containing protein [Candidatus Polarisedimenticolia bacterium]
MRLERMFAVIVTVALLFPAMAPPAAAATLRGTVKITERRGEPGDPSGAVVWLEGAPGGAATAERATVDMSSKTFRPAVIAVPVGSTVTFPNADPILHNVFSVSADNQFDLGLYGRGPGRAATFSTPGIVRIYCNVHPQMEAFVVVTPGPWRATVAADGSYTISDAPAGRYQARVWHERGGSASQPVEVAADGTVTADFSLDAAGYRRRSHLDKDGKPYTGREKY